METTYLKTELKDAFASKTSNGNEEIWYEGAD